MRQLFAVCLPGFEPFLRRELEVAGIAQVEATSPDLIGDEEERGGVAFSGEWGDVYRANLTLRTAGRILVRISTIQASTFEQLREKTARMPWSQFLPEGKPIAFRVACSESRLYHTDGVAQRVAEGISDRLGRPVEIQKFDDKSTDPPQLIVVRVVNDRATISLDSSGNGLHRRGYRQAIAKAPLRETFAAAMILASGWDRMSPLLDPFCGSGTIPIEAALMAMNRAPGISRRFAFMDWPVFDGGLWERLVEDVRGAERDDIPLVFGSDRDAGAIRSSIANAERAGVADRIQFTCRAVSSIEPPSGLGWVITNPPYGVRISRGKDLRNLYAKFGNTLRETCRGWNVSLLCGDPILIGQMGLSFDEGISLRNGGVRVRLLKARAT